MRRPMRAAAACLLVAGILGTVGAPASAGTHKKLHHQQHAAARLDARAHRQAQAVAASRVALRRLDAEANAALAALQDARLAAAKAQEASDAAQSRLAAAEGRTATARAHIATLAGDAYRTMGSGGALASTLSLLQTADPQHLVEGLQVIGEVGQSQQDALDELRVAEAGQLRSEHEAAAAAALALSDQHDAVVAKQHSDSLVRQQHQELAHQRTLLAGTRQAAATAHQRVTALKHKIAVARARAAAIRRAQQRRVASGIAPVAGCNGGSVAGYGNGQLPTSALCALWGAPGQMLQASAAASFNRMSHAYAAAFGTPLCVTASYRTYQHQVELYATMPAGYAAVPGTSNHGWGLAVDLCGGIQVDSSPEHMWLLDHAAAYDWFHPSWAMPGGPGPHEPWHWEYAG